MPELTGLGVLFQRENDTTAEQFDDVAFVASIAPPQLTRETMDVEELAPENDIKRKLVGLIDGGEFTVTLNFDVADAHEDLRDDFDAGVAHNYRIQFPGFTQMEGEPGSEGPVKYTGGYYDLTGIVTGFAQQEIAASSVMQVEVTFAVTAKPEFTPAEEEE